jgi:hypothetical protein
MDQMKHTTGVMGLTILLWLFGAPVQLQAQPPLRHHPLGESGTRT